MLAPQTKLASRSSGPGRACVIGAGSRPQERGPPPSSSGRIGPPKTSMSGAASTPASIAPQPAVGAWTSSSMNTISSPCAACDAGVASRVRRRATGSVTIAARGVRHRGGRRDRARR